MVDVRDKNVRCTKLPSHFVQLKASYHYHSVNGVVFTCSSPTGSYTVTSSPNVVCCFLSERYPNAGGRGIDLCAPLPLKDHCKAMCLKVRESLGTCGTLVMSKGKHHAS